jgi:hypothetical protein
MTAHKRPLLSVLAIALVTAAVLFSFGQPLWCACGSPNPSSFEVWSSHNSQHFVDPYSLSHMLHGVLFFFPLAWLLKGDRAKWRFPAAVGLEAAWEILENTPFIIGRYRENTASLDYLGDSIGNSLADLAFCGLGFVLAASIPWWGSVLVFLAFELIMLAWIRDSLTLNVIMLVSPIEAIKEWQQG